MFKISIFIFIISIITNQSYINKLSIVTKNLINNNNKLNKYHSNVKELNGIPKLFRWLIDLYPIVLESVNNNKSNKNSMNIDNFYLDMNGIIHSCTHSNNDKLIALNELQMFQRIFSYTDSLYKLIKPNKLMYLAIDGVAPRAKMNQQRSRRFRSSKERDILLSEYILKEGKLPTEESFDSNCITPGTEFMYRLGIAFRSWLDHKMKTDSFYQNGATIIFSGPDEPGEGEHKVMDMIRKIQKENTINNIDKNTLKHCMYGLDADLIMLSLITHETNFILLREKINRRNKNLNEKNNFSTNDFEILEITLLRQMLQQHYKQLLNNNFNIFELNKIESLEYDMIKSDLYDNTKKLVNDKNVIQSNSIKEKVEIERVIDDFVFTCFFIGNDFLPSLPHLDIADGSLNLMMNIYKDLIPKLGGYLTDKNSIHLPRLELFIQEVARREPLYFQQRAIDDKEPGFADEGYREFYYKSKFGIDVKDTVAIRNIVQSYIEGLVWVLTYYHHGCQSWIWYYPYLYAPLASDLVNLSTISLKFKSGYPFTPLLQLLSVLPPQSSSFLPGKYADLMTNEQSPLVHYYPKDFEIDQNGKKNSWECIVKIPFIDENDLIKYISMIDHYKDLTINEKLRNIKGIQSVYQPNNKVNIIDSKAVSKIDNEVNSINSNLDNNTDYKLDNNISNKSIKKEDNPVDDVIDEFYSNEPTNPLSKSKIKPRKIIKSNKSI